MKISLSKQFVSPQVALCSKGGKGKEVLNRLEKAAGNNKRLLSIPQVTQNFGGTANMWRQRIWKGEIPIVRIGRKFFLDTQDIECFITQNKMRFEV